MKPLRVAIADDEPEMREFLARICRGSGLEVLLTVDNGAILATESLRERPELVITDIMMPLLDGLSALSAIRAVYPVRSIVITAYDQFSLRQQAEALGALAFLIKPVGVAELVPILRQAAAG